MNNIIIKSYNMDNPCMLSNAKMVYRKCTNCGQILCNTEFDGSVFIATECPNCNIPFVSENEKINHIIMTKILTRIFKGEN